jgi:hypothetical protein
MKKIILTILFLLFQINTTSACIPHSTANLIIWIYEGIETKKHPDWSTLQFIKLKDVSKPFAWNYPKLWKYYFLHSDDNQAKYNMDKYIQWDLIVAIADSNNWSYEDYFAVYEIGKIVSVNEKVDIQEKQWTIKNWWKNLWWCWNFKPDEAMSEQKLLEELSKKIELKQVTTEQSFWLLYYISGSYFIDRFIQGKWENYIWIWIILQLWIYILYTLFFIYLFKYFKKKK